MKLLQEYHWPGNVRELESVIERAVIVSGGSSLLLLDRFNAIRSTGEPFMIVVGAVAINRMKAMDDEVELLIKDKWPKSRKLNDMELQIGDERG